MCKKKQLVKPEICKTLIVLEHKRKVKTSMVLKWKDYFLINSCWNLLKFYKPHILLMKVYYDWVIFNKL